ALAFLDQDAIETYDGAAMRLAAVGSPVWRAHLTAWPASGSFEIVSGKNTWSMPCSVLSAESASTLKEPAISGPSANSRTMEAPRPPQPLARLRWETPLEASAPLLVANWTGSASYWALNPGGAWVPFEASRMLGLYNLPATAAPSDAASKKVWRPVPFWDETWGGYAGARRPDSALARSMDALLNAAANEGETRPLILFDGASLERQGVFNWASHPLRSKLAGPGDIFRTEEGFDFCARWMRYCLARYASSPAVSSLLITTDLNAPGASEFHARLAPLLKEWRAGSSVQKPLVSFHPLAQPAHTVKDIGSFDSGSKSQDAAWHLDQRLSRAYGKLIDRVGLGGGRCFEASVIES
ncbi:MAG: hypothetical protein WCT04_28210, partial [Planctomycetota bacterium]